MTVALNLTRYAAGGSLSILVRSSGQASRSLLHTAGFCLPEFAYLNRKRPTIIGFLIMISL